MIIQLAGMKGAGCYRAELFFNDSQHARPASVKFKKWRTVLSTVNMGNLKLLATLLISLFFSLWRMQKHRGILCDKCECREMCVAARGRGEEEEDLTK